MYHGNCKMRVMAAIAIGSDHTLIGMIIKSIAISLDCVSMSILLNRLQSAWIVYQWMSTVGSTVGSMLGSMVGSKVGLMVGSMVGSTLLCWAINLSKAFDSSDERLSRLSAERVYRARR
jgi:hypothetical protein